VQGNKNTLNLIALKIDIRGQSFFPLNTLKLSGYARPQKFESRAHKLNAGNII